MARFERSRMLFFSVVGVAYPPNSSSLKPHERVAGSAQGQLNLREYITRVTGVLLDSVVV